MDIAQHPVMDHLAATANLAQSADPGITERPKLLLALMHDTRSQARDLLAATELSGADCRWVAPEDMANSAVWEATLRRERPEILLTGWGSPRLPDAIVDDETVPLRYICHLAGTVREFLPRRLVERGILVTNWGSSISYTIAEHAMLLTLAALRNLPRWQPFLSEWPLVHRGPSRRVMQTRSLRGKRVGLHGFGAIARELVGLLRAFGADISAYSYGVPEKVMRQHGVKPIASLEQLFSQSEVLIEVEALSAVNTRSVTYEVLSLLPEGAVFVNVGRGAVVDQEALIQVARERHLRLGLDVFEKEPLPLESGLRDLPEAVLSPHLAGPTYDAFPGMWEFAMGNLRAYLSQGADAVLEGVVTPEVYDRCT